MYKKQIAVSPGWTDFLLLYYNGMVVIASHILHPFRTRGTMDLDKQLPNYFMHFILHRLEDTVGKNGTNTVLKYTGNDVLIDNYPPRDYNMGEPIRTFTSIISGLVEIYGENGYRALIRGVGAESFHIMREELPFILGIGEIDYDGMEPKRRFTTMHQTFINKMNEFFDAEVDSEILDNKILDKTSQCTWCTGVTAKRPICIFTEDFYTAMAKWLNLGHVVVTELTCMATGDPVCKFEILTG